MWFSRTTEYGAPKMTIAPSVASVIVLLYTVLLAQLSEMPSAH